MFRLSLTRLLMLFVLAATISGCILSDSGSESGTSVYIAPAPDPKTYVCNPLDEGGGIGSATEGVAAELSYLTDEMPRYGNLNEFFANSVKVENLILYFNQIYIPTRPFDRGFVTAGGQQIQTADGDDLYEYFGVKMRGRFQLGDLAPGAYQFAVLADDGANLYMDFGSGMELVVNNDGNHPTKMACGSAPVIVGANDKIPFELHYYQGPRFHISLVLMARPLVAGEALPFESECGQQGNSRFFDSTQDPVVPQAAYLNLLARGWAPVEPSSYLLPEDLVQNPCNDPAPVISNLVVTTVAQTSVTLNWSTDRYSTTQVFFKRAADSTYTVGPSDVTLVTSHATTVTGLTANTDYNIYVRSTSNSGLWSESSVLNVRTRR